MGDTLEKNSDVTTALSFKIITIILITGTIISMELLYLEEIITVLLMMWIWSCQFPDLVDNANYELATGVNAYKTTLISST